MQLIFIRHSGFISRIAVAIAAVACLLPAVSTAAEYNPARTKPKAEQQAASTRVIVKLRADSRVQAQAAAAGENAAATAADTARVEALVRRSRLNLRGARAIGGGMHALSVSPQAGGETVEQTLARLRADSEVEDAVVDRPVYAHAVPNDPRATGQWYLAAAQPSAIRAQAAWDITKGRTGVVVAVLDTGVRFEHPDLGRSANGGRFLAGYDFVSAPDAAGLTRAADGDGVDADPSDPGDSCSSGESSSWHGTRVSGIISALTDNGIGVAGILWNSVILPVRVLGKCDGRNSDVLAGMRWAAGLSVPGVPANPNPARIINLSLGSEGSCDSLSAEAVRDVTATGALVVVSAGNEGGPVDTPANCAGAMGVAGLRHAGTKVGFSSLGPEVGLGAPGGNCVNTAAGQPCVYSIDTTSNDGVTTPGNNTYTDQTNYNVGTSFSAPIVSGIAGLMLSVNGNLKSAQLISRLKASALPFPTTSDTGITTVCHTPVGSSDIQNTECICTTSACGAGMANAIGAVNEALRPIAAINAPASYAANATVTLQASGSAAACGRSVASYAWSIDSGPGTLTSNNTASTSIQAPASGSTTIVRLVVTDDQGKTDAATITLNATASSTQAPANAGTSACLADEAFVSVVASDANASEAGLNTGAFTFSRSGNTTSAVAVTYTMSGVAISGTDYVSLPGTATIPAGQSSVTITLTPIDDDSVEGPETATLTLQPVAGYALGTSAASLSIADNDAEKSGGGGAVDTMTLLALLLLAMRAAWGARRPGLARRDVDR